MFGFRALALSGAFALLTTAHAFADPVVDVNDVFFFKHGHSDPTSWEACWSFTNRADKDATVVRFRVVWKDAFGTPIKAGILDRVGSFAPNVSIDGPKDTSQFALREYDNSWGEKMKNCGHQSVDTGTPNLVTVYAIQVRYTDGSTWTPQR